MTPRPGSAGPNHILRTPARGRPGPKPRTSRSAPSRLAQDRAGASQVQARGERRKAELSPERSRPRAVRLPMGGVLIAVVVVAVSVVLTVARPTSKGPARLASPPRAYLFLQPS